MKKIGFQAGTKLAIACVAVLVAGCSGDPANSDVIACILDASGHEKVGKEKVNAAMGIEYSRTIIDNVNVKNIIPQDGNRWLAQVSIRVGDEGAWSGLKSLAGHAIIPTTLQTIGRTVSTARIGRTFYQRVYNL